VLGAAALALLGCGGGQTRGEAFEQRWRDEGGEAVRAFEQSLHGARMPAGADVAVGVVEGSTLIGAPLDGGPTWTYEHALDSRPAIAGTVVVGLGGGELFALDARTGTPLWTRRVFGLLRGAGDDGATTVVSLAPLTGKGSIVLAVDHEGHVVRQIEDEAVIGEPAVLDGYAFLPWRGQYVTIYDLHAGEERARVLVRSLTSRAFASGGALFFGERGVTRFDDRVYLSAKGGASHVNLPERDLPGDARWIRPGAEPAPIVAGATDKVRLYARPTASGAFAIDSGRYAATYFRVALGLDAKTGAITWAHTHESDFLGGAASEGSFALCDAAGRVTFFDAKSGAPAASVSLGRRVDACVVQVDRLKAPEARATSPLAEQLAKAVLLPDADLTAIQRVLLSEMVKQGGATITRALIALVDSERAAPPLRADARTALATHKGGAEVMLEALGRRYDYLGGVLRPPPVGALSEALAAMGEKRAAPLLVQHLGDPATAPEDVRGAARALVKLSGPGELDALRTFFAQYRGFGPPQVHEAIGDAVVASAEALLKLGARDVVESAARDAFTHAALKPRLSALVEAAPAKVSSR